MNLMRFSTVTCKVLHLGRWNPRDICRLEGATLGKSSRAEKDLGILVETEYEPAACSCSVESKWYRGLHQRRGGQQAQGGDCVTLLCL